MNLLLDTHIVLWASAARSKLPVGAAKLLEKGEHILWVSAVTFWEVAIKRSLNKPDFRIDVAPLRAGLLRNGHFELAIDGMHAMELAKLEGIIPALEPAHALFALSKFNFKKDGIVIVNLSGRGDKDLSTYMKFL